MKFSKLIKGFFVFLLLLVVLAVAIPYFFQDEIKEKIKADVDNSINAKVDFSSVSLSLFKNFPNFSFQMEDFSVMGIEEFEGVSLVKADEVGFSLDLMSVFNSEAPIQINSINLIKPDIDIIVLENGKSNYDIAKTDPDAAPTESGDYNFVIQLQKYLIQEGHFTYDDRVGNIFVELDNINHNGKGDFTQEVFDLVTKTQIDKITARSGGIQYINKAKGELDITLHSDFPNMKFTLKENELQINDLELKADGWLELVGDNINMDFKFDAPSNNFKSFLSLIPNAYTKDFDNIKTDGQLKLDGYVKGTYNEKSIPAFDLNLDIKDAYFQYPDLPMGVKDINATANIKSPNSDLDNMVVDVSKFKMLIGSNPFLGKLKLTTPLSDPDIDTKIKGNINFAELAKAFPMEGVESITGTMKADMEADARMSSIEQGDYQNVNMKGIFQLNQFSYQAKDMPRVLIQELALNFTPKKVEVLKFLSKLGKSDLRATGSIDNILAYISPKQTMKGQLEVRSNFFDANEWISDSAPETTSPQPEVSEPVAVFDRFDFDLDAKFNKVEYDIYEMENMELRGNATSNKISIQKFVMDIGDSDIRATGNIANAFDYLYKNETLTGDITLTSNLLDLNQFMVEVPESDGKVKAQKIADTEAAGPILIPDNIKMNIDANVRKIRYTNLDLKNLKGRVAVQDNKAELQNCVANIFGGQMVMDGEYNTANPEKPAFDLEYQIKQWDFQNAFKNLNTFKSIAPIGEFISGKFNSKFEIFGLLDDEMFPDLATLTADGFLHTLQGSINKFEPLQKVGNKLNVKALKEMDIKDTKNWFEVKDGRMNLQEFNYKYEDIDMLISGSHGFDTDMDYKILAKIPRELWQNNAAGKAAGKGLDFLKGEAGKLGVNLDMGDFIDVQINILGTMKDPKIKIKPLGSGGKSLKDTAKDVVKDAVTKVKETATEKVEEVKKEVKEKVDNKKAELKAKADAEYKKIMDKANANAKKIRSEADKLAAKTTREGYKQADKLVSDAGKNPIKKIAAKKASDVLKKQTDKKAKQIKSEADKRAKQVIAKGKKAGDAARKRILGG